MHITVKLFALARDLAGRADMALDLPAEPTVGALRRTLVEHCPALQALAPRLMIAVNMDYAPDDRVLNANDEIACIPPVSGG